MRKLVCAAVAAVFLVVTSGIGLAEVTTPTSRARARKDGSVRVTCHRYKGVGSRDLTTMEFERSEDGAAFDPLIELVRPRRSQSIYDVPGPGTFFYRCRVISDTGTSGWSVPAMVTTRTPPAPKPTKEPRPDATVAPTAQPTPQPTAQPTAQPNPGSGSPPLPAGQRECRDGVLEEILDLVNAARQTAGRSPLRGNAQLDWAARSHSIQMARSGVLTHEGWYETIIESGYRGSYFAENIAVGYPSPASVMQGWMGSTGHRNNILNGSLRDIGIGCVTDSRGSIWWTQDFGG